MSREQINQKRSFYYIIDGSFRQKVSQDHPEAQRRDWKSADGKNSGTKYERHVDALFGKIEDVQFFDSDYGLNINITLDENEQGEHPIIQLGASTREGEDFMRKLPNLDLAKEVRFRPFNFTGSDSNEVRGIELMQQDDADNFTVKATNFFRDAEKKENINGLPKPPKENEEMTKPEWKIYFLQVNLFLIEYTKNKIIPKFQDIQFVKKNEVQKPPSSLEEENRDPNAVPF